MPKNKSSDEPVIVNLSKKKEESFLSSGIPELDEAIGGIPIGRITEFWGGNAVGKTHTISQIMTSVSQDKKVLMVDSEFALNKARVASFGANMDNIDFYQDARLERVCELLIASVGKYDLIILDSLAYLTPTTIENQLVGENAIGLFSRLIKHWVIKFRPRLGVSKTAFIAVNQYRKPLGMYVKAEPPGGTSWLHAVDVRVKLSTNENDKIEKNKKRVGHWVRFEILKSKVSQPFISGKYEVNY